MDIYYNVTKFSIVVEQENTSTKAVRNIIEDIVKVNSSRYGMV